MTVKQGVKLYISTEDGTLYEVCDLGDYNLSKSFARSSIMDDLESELRANGLLDEA